MDLTLPFGGVLAAVGVFFGKKALTVATTKVKAWDKHLTDDDRLHAVIEVKLTEQGNRLKSVDEKLDRLVDHMLDK